MEKFNKLKVEGPFDNLKNRTAEQIQEAQRQINESIKNQFDEIFIQALKFKGFEFESRHDLEKFVSQNCSSLTESKNPTTTYFYCYGEPFLKTSWDDQPKINFRTEEQAPIYYANFYKYEFI